MSEFDLQLLEAKNRVKSMDEADGFKDRDLNTILLALECGIKRPETGAQFDAYVMLLDVCKGAKQ
jgi:hypothetical protein